MSTPKHAVPARWRCLECDATGRTPHGLSMAAQIFHEHWNTTHQPDTAPEPTWLERDRTPLKGMTPTWTGIDDEHIGTGKRRAHPAQARQSASAIRGGAA